MANSNALTLKSARSLLESRKDEIAKALVNRIDPEAFIRVAHMAMSKNPALLEATPSSLLMALLESASLGLMPNGVLGHAYIIPYRNKGVMEAQFQPGYRGLIDLARRSGQVKSIVPRSVNENDTFQVEYGLEEKLYHVPNLDDPGKLRFVYAIAHLTDGTSQFHIMPIKDVERIRAKSRAANNGPWVTDYEAMAWKTVIKQLIKFLPLSLETDQAVQQDNAVEFGGDIPVFSAAVPEREPERPASRTEQLRERIAPRQIAPAAVEEDAVEEQDAVVEEDEPDNDPFGDLDDEDPSPSAALETNNPAAQQMLAMAGDMALSGGDASDLQRSRLTQYARALFGEGTDEALALESIATNPQLGKGQVGRLLSKGKEAMEFATKKQPAAAGAASDSLFS